MLRPIRDMVAKEADFKGVDIETANGALDVFWEHEKDTITNNLMVDKRFIVQSVISELIKSHTGRFKAQDGHH